MLARLAAWLDRLFWPGLDAPKQPCLPASEVIRDHPRTNVRSKHYSELLYDRDRARSLRVSLC